MTGFELLIGPAAEGLAALITDTTKTGSSSVIGSAIKGLADKSKQAIFQASRKYIENYQKRHCQLKVLGMREPVELSAVYTGVKLLDDRGVSQFESEALEEAFRQTRLRGYSSSYGEDEKRSGIVVANEKQYLMVLGGPGAGKSTFLRKVGLETLRTFHYERAEYDHRLIPVLLELKRFEADDIDIAKVIAAEFETCGFPESENFAKNALAQGNLLVLLDGLDEVPSANLNNVLKTIQDFVDLHDKNRFIASCRVAASGHRGDAFRRFSSVTMADFDDDQIQQFINNWFGSQQDVERGTASKCWEILQRPENKASKELAHTPLLLTYLCLMYDIAQRFPHNRSSLYRKALRILLEEWAAEKRILRDDIYEGLSIEQEEILLSEMAYEGMVADQLFFTKRELSAQIREFLASNLNAPKHLDSEAVLNAIEVQQGILVERAEDAYSFSHLTLQEYLTAQHLANNAEWEPLVRLHLVDERWREVFLLLPGLIVNRSGADKFLLVMEKQANIFLKSHKLQQLLRWAKTVTRGVTEGVESHEKRALAVLTVCTFDRDRGLNSDRDSTRALAISYTHRAFNIDCFDTLLMLGRSLSVSVKRGYMHSRTLNQALELSSYLSESNIFRDVDLDKLSRDIKRLRGNKLGTKIEATQRTQLSDNLYDLWFSALGIKPEVALLSQEDSQLLANYFYVCELMIRCKEGAVRVSPDVWAGIESRILTVPASSEAVAD